MDVPLDRLLSKEYADQRRKLIDPNDGLGGATARATRRRPSRRSIVGDPRVYTGDTTHLDVVDGEGNMFAATPSGGWIPTVAGGPGPRVPARDARPAVLPRSRPTRTRWCPASGRAPR